MAAGGWQWLAHGKHPVARDYFTIGKETPMARAIFDWVQRGCQNLTDEAQLKVPCSWRFWVRSPLRNNLLCGIVRNSCDGLGRPFPLLLLGSGIIQDWEAHWAALPQTCEDVWQQMEHLSIKRINALEQMRNGLRLIKAPNGQWRSLGGMQTGAPLGYEKAHQELCQQLQDQRHAVMRLSALGPQELTLEVQRWHETLAGKGVQPPTAVFMGGSLVQTYLVIFADALGTEDFKLLWAIGCGAEQTH